MKRKIYTMAIIVVLITLIFSISYAFYTFVIVSHNNNTIISGKLYIDYEEEVNTILLNNVFPMTKEEAILENNNYITFTISGANESLVDTVYYDINLNYGSNIADKTRFKDKDIKFRLTEIINNEEVVLIDEMSYDNFNNRKIYINTVPSGTTGEIEHTYRLRMWIDGNIIISNSDVDATYSEEEFENSYANIKISVSGDTLVRTSLDNMMVSNFPSNILENKFSIKEVYFVNNTLDNLYASYNSASIKSDLTYENNGKVLCWLENNSDDVGMYNLYIGSNGTTYLTNGNSLFMNFINLEKIDFGNINTSLVSDMSSMLENCYRLWDYSLDSFNYKKGVNTFNMIRFVGKKITFVESPLPTGYDLLEYIEGNGTNYIDTGITTKSSINVEAKVYAPNYTAANYVLFGGRSAANASLAESFTVWGIIATSKYARYDRGGKNGTYDYKLLQDGIHNIKTSGNSLYIDDVMVTTTSGKTTSYSSTANIYLFGQNTANVNDFNLAGIKFYNCKIYDAGVLVRDFIPSYKRETNEVGMYDLVTNTFYSRKGTGDFNYDVVPVMKNESSPNNPIQITNSLGSTRNLFNQSLFGSISENKDGITVQYLENEDCFLLNGMVSSSESASMQKWINLLATVGTNYSISTTYVSGNIIVPSNGKASVYFGNADAINDTNNWGIVDLKEENTSQTIINDKNCITKFWFYFTKGVSFTNYKVRVQLEEGSVITDYIPARQIENVPKNLINATTFDNGYYSTDNVFVSSSTNSMILNSIEVSPNTVYTLSINTTVNYLGLEEMDASLNPINRLFSLANVYKNTFETGANTKYVRIWINANNSAISASDILNYNPQLELGTDATDYEPSLSNTYVIDMNNHEDLNTIGNISDTIDYVNSLIVRNIGKIEFTGTETNWSKNMFTNTFRFDSSSSNVNSEISGYCTHFTNSNLGINKADIILRVSKNIASNVNEWKAFLANQYSKGTPVTIYYVLNSPIYEPVNITIK